MSDSVALSKLPGEDSPDYFRLLVRNCIETYKKLPNDALCLDYNKVSGKLRVMILDDEEYQKETRNIYARQQLEAISKIDYLERLASSEADEDDGDPRNRGRKKKISGADKDMLTMRFKAAQMRRELIASLNEDNSASEQDAANFMFVNLSRKDIEENVRYERYEGTGEDGLEELVDSKEEAPEGTGGTLRRKGQNGPLDEDAFFDVLPDGEIVEK